MAMDLCPVRVNILLRDPEQAEERLREVETVEEARTSGDSILRHAVAAVPELSAVREWVRARAGVVMEWDLCGNIPIVLSAPHGGKAVLEGTVPRVDPGSEIDPTFCRTSDMRTYELTKGVVSRLWQDYGVKPCYVLAKCHRKYVDLNRPPSRAYARDAPSAALYYYAYHTLLTSCISNAGPSPLLLDIHGHGRAATSHIYRGTIHGRTCSLQTDIPHGHPALAKMASHGRWKLIPHHGIRENYDINGGWTVQTYGISSYRGTNAIQLEFGKDHRLNDDGIANAAEAIATGIAHHLGLSPTNGDPMVQK
eukprot:TRINITY_DN29217_c0_g1_i1.p1 TRINITY_DN29217_c0_g1~~TRINITY_DN29217_c0_g1_i1.p1  ORF type:complete len:320 (+),score=32.90 TRINITY_DN29217_c0_g1_i1:35-961(+)